MGKSLMRTLLVLVIAAVIIGAVGKIIHSRGKWGQTLQGSGVVD
jgi:hypothetical protein